jgi:sugar phosphate isomerase/epimerase
MFVALHSAPEGFFKTGPPHRAEELFDLVETAMRLGFKCFQIGPTCSFTDIDGDSLRVILDKYGMERNVHVGGLYDAEKFAVSEAEWKRAQNDLHRGIELSTEVSSPLVSIHPPFFKSTNRHDDNLISQAKTRFLKITEEELDFAQRNGVKLALESFCYPPFIFTDLQDFMQFVSHFRSSELGVLLEVGHLYQARFNLDEAIQTFGDRIFEVHVHDATLHEDYKKATHLPIGSGNIDFLGVINSLRKVKYDGWLTLEIHGDEGKILESKKLLENLIAS